MDVKELVEGYCQVTGRPTFTITVDEYIKFHQVALFNSPKPTIEIGQFNEVSSSKVDVKPLENHSEQSDKANKVAVDETPLSKESKNKSTPIKKEVEVLSNTSKKVEEVSITNVKDEKPKNNKQIALNLLKSIQG